MTGLSLDDIIMVNISVRMFEIFNSKCKNILSLKQKPSFLSSSRRAQHTHTHIHTQVHTQTHWSSHECFFWENREEEIEHIEIGIEHIEIPILKKSLFIPNGD